ncbi:MAG: hypothetical protein NVV74_07620 [Magnetospirillum sp.]|nr:hypothetical protein [Magnetospirillum sp.]
MDDTLKQRIRAHLKANEGEEPQPYRDSNGNLTVGVGINVNRKADFVAQKLQTKDAKTGELRDASPKEKADEFDRLSKMSELDIKHDTKRFILPKAEIDAKLDEKIAEHEAGVKRQIGEADWNKLTDGQKTAVLDVHYANPGGLDNFPKLKDAIKNGDAREMANQSDFHGGQIEGTDHQHRNFDRLRRNKAAMQGIDPESDEAFRQVADSYPDHPKLPPEYKDHRDLSVLRPEPRPQDEPGQPQPSPQPAPQPTPTQEQTASKPPADPKVASLVAMASSPIDNPGRSALLKPVDKLTQSEMTDMIHSAQEDYRGWRSGDPLKAHTYEKVQDWHVNIYGDQPQGNDGGKPIEPMPIRPIPEQPSPHTTPQGEDLWQATARIGRQVADAAGSDGAAEAIKGLQRGLNMLGEANPLPARSPAYGPYTKLGPVDEDGAYGPQTDFALKHATAHLGPNKVDEAFALGRFNTFARNAQRNGNPEGLEDRTHAIFGPLFRNGGNGPKGEAGVLQETLNQFGSREDDWQDLKVDDWVGPKTTEAFGRVLKDEDADSFTSAFGENLGLL